MGKRIGIEYGRYSSGGQGKGHSEERQDAGAAAWCKRHGVELDTTTVYMDRGTSAFHGKHRKAGSPLRAFLDEVEAERIPRGSLLIIENLDRLSRENPWVAIPLLCQVVNSGLDVVTLSPSEHIYTQSGDLTGLILAVVEFGRGHSESKSKSDRLAAVWQKRKQAARDNGAIITRRLPAWVQVKGEKLMPVPERVIIIRRIFDLAITGHGLFEIVRTLTREKVKPWGRGDSWNKAYLRKIISGRSVLGEHQPMRDGQPDGEPMPNYYPQVIDPETWQRAQTALSGRREKAGRVGVKVTNLFSGLMTDALGGQKMLIAWQTQGSGDKRRKVRCLVPAGAMEGRQASITLPYAVFERAVLKCLKEITPADLTGSETAPESTGLVVEAAALESRMKDIEAELLSDGEDVPALAKVLRQLDSRLQDVLRRLRTAQQQEANPMPAILTEAQTLLEVANDEQRRLRLRTLLTQLVESIHVIITAGRSVKLCAVQIAFRRGVRRDYIIRYNPARRGVKGGWSVRSNLAEDLEGIETLEGWSVSLTGGDLKDLTEADETRSYLQSLTTELLEIIFRGCEVYPT